MPFNGSGSFTPPGASFPAVAGTLIEAAKFNAVINDIATGLSTCITKDGQTTVTANIPMGGYRLTGLGAGIAAGQSLRYEQLGFSPYTTTATAAGTTTLTSSSTQTQYFTGTTTQSVTMPVVSTLTLGQTFIIVNLSTGSLTVRASDASSVILTVPANTQATFTVIAITGTDATSWNVEITGFASATGTGAVARATSPTFVTPTLGVASATSINFGGSTLSSYVSSSFTGTLTGGTTAPTGTIYYVKTGDGVILDSSGTSFTATSNSTSKSITGMPAGIRPTSVKVQPVIVSDNGGANVLGECIWDNSGVIAFYTSLSAGAWTASGTANLSRFQLAYTMN